MQILIIIFDFSTFAMIKPVSPALHGKVLTFIIKKGFRILQMKNVKLGLNLARDMYSHLSGNKELPLVLGSQVTFVPCNGLVLVWIGIRRPLFKMSQHDQG